MGRYITWDLMANRYPDAAKVTGAENVSSAWLYGVEAEVDARLSPRYTVPFSTVPDIVRDLCVDLLYARMMARQEGSQVIYERVIGLIGEIVAGTIAIPGVSPTTTGGRSFASNSYRSAFGPDDPLNWSRSQTQVDDAIAERLGD
jgi:phage gp36-like protein